MNTALHPKIATWFRAKYGELTPAQRDTIPHILRGESVLLSSPTGTGKTLAAFLGIFDFLLRQQEFERLGAGIVAVYLSPLRALAYDIQKNLHTPLQELGFGFVRVGMRTGDSTAKERAALKKKPPHILVTTPESLALLLSQATYAAAFTGTRFLIIDELHALLENKRGVHLMVSAERLEIIAQKNPSPSHVRLCRIGLSATIAPLEKVAACLVGDARACAIVTHAAQRKTVIEVFSPIRKNPYPAAGYTAGRVLRELAGVLQEARTTLIFTNTRGGAESIGLRLKELLPHLAQQIAIHHASLDRSIRLEVEDRLKNGELRAVVCSATLELGIDIGTIDRVIMISAPKGVARALQRIGRSGHSLQQQSHGLLVATNINDLVECSVTARLMERCELEPVRVPENCFDVLAQHLVSLALTEEFTPEEAFTFVRRAYSYRHLTRTDFTRVLAYLQGGGAALEKEYASAFGKVRVVKGRLVTTHKKVARDFFQNVGTITSESMVRVKLRRRSLGQVEESFLKRLKIGDVFVLNGQVVRLVKTHLLEAEVVWARGESPTVPRWNATKMPLASGLAREVVRLRSRMADLFSDLSLTRDQARQQAIHWLVEEYQISASNAEAIARQMELQSCFSTIPTAQQFLVEVFPEDQRLHYFFHSLIGRSANDALSRIVAWRLRTLKGGNAMVTIDDYGFLLTVRNFQKLDLAEWKTLFSPENAEMDLRAALRESELVKWQFRGVAQTGLMVAKNVHGAARKPGALQWSVEVLFEVLQKHEPEHPILVEAYRDAMHQFLDLPHAREFLTEAARLPWQWHVVTKISPFAFGIFVSRIKETMMMEDPETAVERLYHELYRQLENNETNDISTA